MLAPTDGKIRKTYLDSAVGQLHLRYVAPRDAAPRARPVVLFASSPNSGELYDELLVELGRDRLALAFDTPGYGESSPLPDAPEDPRIFADLFEAALASLQLGPVDAFGHHSGATLSLALAAYYPDRVAHVAVTGVPYVPDAEERATLRARRHSFADTAQVQAYAERNWKYWVENRSAALPLARAVELYVDSLSAHVRMNWLYRSVYADDADAWLRTVTSPVAYLQISDFLSANSLLAAELTPNRTIRDLPDLDHASMITAPAAFGAVLREAFDPVPTDG